MAAAIVLGRAAQHFHRLIGEVDADRKEVLALGRFLSRQDGPYSEQGYALRPHLVEDKVGGPHRTQGSTQAATKSWRSKSSRVQSPLAHFE